MKNFDLAYQNRDWWYVGYFLGSIADEMLFAMPGELSI